jgi:hypothetical protein
MKPSTSTAVALPMGDALGSLEMIYPQRAWRKEALDLTINNSLPLERRRRKPESRKLFIVKVR